MDGLFSLEAVVAGDLYGGSGDGSYNIAQVIDGDVSYLNITDASAADIEEE